MDLSSLYTSLEPGQLAQAERQMMENFRAAALSITTLYKSSLNTSKQAYTAGYSACLNDIIQTLQASLATTSDSQHPQNAEEAGRTVGRLMDWIEARQEALKLQAEDEREEQISGMQPESSMQAAARDRERNRETAHSRAEGSVRGRPEPTATEDSTMDGGDADSERRRAVIPAIHPKQRDALVQAVNRQQQQQRSRGTDTPSRQPDIESPPVFSGYQHRSSIDSSSPLQQLTTPTFHTRPSRPLPHHKGKSSATMITALDPDPFNPDLPLDLPFLPLFDPNATEHDDDATDFDFRIGSKRPLEAVALTGLKQREGTASAPPTGKARRRQVLGVDPASDGEERERKRLTRRG